MAENKFQRFGKYLILDHLVDGGMAKICRATYLGEQANKVVAIKMVQAQYSKDPSFVQMFEDELKVSFDLVHPNIAQVYDYGMVDEQLYSAMEYVDGANLKQFLDRLKEKKYVFPVEISTYIISQVCQALHYAHNYQDKLTGKSFNIIHRDISPHNIMLTYAGVVKVIDFGIAKADSNSEATQAGTIKGKLSYLGPECLDGLELDHRYDQFAVGITLWEMLCSRKLFQAKNELAVLKQIQACKVPKPSSINPNVPPELDQIVLKSLSKDRTERYENMDKMNRALVRFLYSNYPEFNATDLGYFAKQLFQEEITADKKKFVEFGKIDLKPFIEDMNRSEQGSSGETSDAGSFVPEEKRTGKIVLDLGNFEEGDDASQTLDLDVSGTTVNGLNIKKPTKSSSGESKKIKRRAPIKKSAPPKAPRVESKSEKAQVRGRHDRSKVGNRVRRGNTAGSSKTMKVRSSRGTKAAAQSKKKSSNLVPMLVACGLAFIVFTQKDMVCDMAGIKGGVCATTPPVNCKVDVTPLQCEDVKTQICKADKDRKVKGCPNRFIAVKEGKIKFNNLDLMIEWEYYLDGKKVKMSGSTISGIDLSKDYKELVVKHEGYKPRVYRGLNFAKAEDNKIVLDFKPMKKLVMGMLSTDLNPPNGTQLQIEVNGEIIEKELPFKNWRIPAGEYNAKIVNKAINTEQNVFIEVKENKNNIFKAWKK